MIDRRFTAVFHRVILLVVLLTSGAPVAAATETPDSPADGRFRAWAGKAAQQLGVTLCRLGVMQYAGQGPAHWALWQAKTGQQSLVFVWEGGRAAYSTQSNISGMECPGSGAVGLERGPTLHVEGHAAMRPRDKVDVSVVDGQVALVQAREDDPDFHSEQDWQTLVEGTAWNTDGSSTGGSMLLALPADSRWRSTLPAPRTWLTFKKGDHGGHADGGLRAEVDLAEGEIRVRLEATDDVFRPAPAGGGTDAGFIKSDHFELWFCARGSGGECEGKSARQLGVARTQAGGVHTRWLHPTGNKEKLPPVRPVEGKTNAVIVAIPLAQIEHQGQLPGGVEGRLTAVYSDADTTGKGQEAVVATSNLKWGKGVSFGRFVRLPQGARFPPWLGSAGFEIDDGLEERLPPNS